jgi:hypothetical protein
MVNVEAGGYGGALPWDTIAFRLQPIAAGTRGRSAEWRPQEWHRMMLRIAGD